MKHFSSQEGERAFFRWLEEYFRCTKKGQSKTARKCHIRGEIHFKMFCNLSSWGSKLPENTIDIHIGRKSHIYKTVMQIIGWIKNKQKKTSPDFQLFTQLLCI